MNLRSELRIYRLAHADTAAPLRHALREFLVALDIETDSIEDILLAVGETLANAVEHAYDGDATGQVELHARVEGEELLSVDVSDEGRFIEREPRSGRGFGLRIVKTVARAVSVEVDGGTRVHMLFDVMPRERDAVPGAITPAG